MPNYLELNYSKEEYDVKIVNNKTIELYNL